MREVRRKGAWVAAVAVCAVSLVAAGPAQASYLQLDNYANDYDVVYTAQPGETNDLTITHQLVDDAIQGKTQQLGIVENQSIQILPAFSPNVDVTRKVLMSCVLSPGRALCRQTLKPVDPTLGSDWSDMSVVLADGNDSVRVRSPGYQLIKAGPGSDSVIGGDGSTVIYPGPGADDVWGGGGRDSVGFFYPGVSPYADLTASLDNLPNDGVAGEEDNIHGDVEDVFGGYGNDVLAGNWRDNLLRADQGDDTITGGAGKDHLYGDGGDDTIYAVDGEADYVSCDRGNDTATVDAVDIIDPLEFSDYGCETVDVVG